MNNNNNLHPPPTLNYNVHYILPRPLTLNDNNNINNANDETKTKIGTTENIIINNDNNNNLELSPPPLPITTPPPLSLNSSCDMATTTNDDTNNDNNVVDNDDNNKTNDNYTINNNHDDNNSAVNNNDDNDDNNSRSNSSIDDSPPPILTDAAIKSEILRRAHAESIQNILDAQKNDTAPLGPARYHKNLNCHICHARKPNVVSFGCSHHSHVFCDNHYNKICRPAGRDVKDRLSEGVVGETCPICACVCTCARCQRWVEQEGVKLIRSEMEFNTGLKSPRECSLIVQEARFKGVGRRSRGRPTKVWKQVAPRRRERRSRSGTAELKDYNEDYDNVEEERGFDTVIQNDNDDDDEQGASSHDDASNNDEKTTTDVDDDDDASFAAADDDDAASQTTTSSTTNGKATAASSDDEIEDERTKRRLGRGRPASRRDASPKKKRSRRNDDEEEENDDDDEEEGDRRRTRRLTRSSAGPINTPSSSDDEQHITNNSTTASLPPTPFSSSTMWDSSTEITLGFAEFIRSHLELFFILLPDEPGSRVFNKIKKAWKCHQSIFGMSCGVNCKCLDGKERIHILKFAARGASGDGEEGDGAR